MNFNPNDYETVKERKLRFYTEHPDGRIVVKNNTPSDHFLDFAIYEVSIYFDKEDQEKGLPKATGTAMEVRDKELSISNQGKTYESVNYTSWTENCEESAVGRALDNAGYSGNKKPSRDEMQKAQRMGSTLSKSSPLKVTTPSMSGSLENAMFCPVHNVKTFKKEKDGKTWYSHKQDDTWCNIDPTKVRKYEEEIN